MNNDSAYPTRRSLSSLGLHSRCMPQLAASSSLRHNSRELFVHAASRLATALLPSLDVRRKLRTKVASSSSECSLIEEATDYMHMYCCRMIDGVAAS